MARSAEALSAEQQLLREMRAQMAAVTGGIAPEDYVQAWWDWFLNVSNDPQKQAEITHSAVQAFTDNVIFAMQAASGQPLAPAADDKRFADAGWSQWPFNIMARGYLNWAQLLQRATTDVPGLSKRSADLVGFSSRQFVEGASPGNSLLTNPELLELTRKQSGRNLVEGFKHWLEDVDRTLTHKPAIGGESFKVGVNVAATPGKIVYRNELIELIQYAATTPTVHAEPILIVPAWIMKYYILDLSRENSLVRYLVDQGHTVFMISWKNPNETDRELGMDDYYNKGLRTALTAVETIVPNQKIHAAGYCIGGTLMSIAAAALARDGRSPLASMTLFAAQTDFSEPGELSLFISPSQLDMLEAMMHKTGTLSSEQMGTAFGLLRANDLLWTPAINTYVRGERQKLNDLMAWNSDGTRMPWRMHSEYLQRLYLQNDLASGRFEVNGSPINLADITVPIFALGTETDHVAPWRSTFKTRELTRSQDFTYVLTNGGHNAGIICGPLHPRRRFRESQWTDSNSVSPPDEWVKQAVLHEGSWWPFWQGWLAARSGPLDAALPPLGDRNNGYPILGDAPGEYVLQR